LDKSSREGDHIIKKIDRGITKKIQEKRKEGFEGRKIRRAALKEELSGLQLKKMKRILYGKISHKVQNRINRPKEVEDWKGEAE